MTVDRYELAVALVGVVALLAAWLPAYIARRPVSLPLLLVLVGVVALALPLGFPSPDPRAHTAVAERLTELGVIVALMGTGLKIDRPLGWRSWRTTWRMLAVAMPVGILGVALLGGGLLGLALPSALLLGAVLAPTDPVLAGDVQVGEPTTVEAREERAGELAGSADDAGAEAVVGTGRAGSVEGPPVGEEDDVRFTLTSEGGLNDALAFPFVYAAILMAEHGTAPQGWLLEWVAVDVVYRLVVALVLGVVIGRLLAVVAFRPPGPLTALARIPQGYVAIAATLLTYGLTELAQGYGFLAVFVAAVTLRSSERAHRYHRRLHDFTAQAESLLVVGLLILFGGAVASGLLSALTWQGALVVVLAVVVVRPLSGLVALVGTGLPRPERWAIAFFGIRGIGSLYYLAYAATAAEFAGIDEIWAVVALTILVSIVLHGITATPVMSVVDVTRRWRHREPRRGQSATA